MPIYQFECLACGQVSERIQSLSAPDLQTCDACGKGPMQKIISRSGFVLKGGGFYTNEYPSASRKAGQAETKPAPAAGTSKPDKAS